MNNGISFVPLDVTLDDKFELIEAEYGIKGFAVIVKLFQKIYGGQGYYCEWTEDVALLFAKKMIGLGGNAVSEIIEAALKRGIFDRGLYDKYGILTSAGIQKRYLKASARKARVELISNYLLIEVTQNYKNVAVLSKNVTETAKNVTESNVNKIKQNEIKLNETNSSAEAVPKELAFDKDVKEVLDFYQENIAPLTPYIAHNIEDWCKDMEHGAVKLAIIEATKHNARHWKYIEAILKTWHSAGRTTLAEVQDANKRRSGKKEFDVFNDKNTDYDEIEKIIRSKM